MHPSKSGYVYVVQGDDDGPVKIGISDDPKRRFRQIQNSSGRSLVRTWVSHLIAYPRSMEAQLHRKFSEHRLPGEWFNVEFDQAVHEARMLSLVFDGVPHRAADAIRAEEIAQQYRQLQQLAPGHDGAVGFCLALSETDLDACSMMARHQQEVIRNAIESMAMRARDVVGQQDAEDLMRALMDSVLTEELSARLLSICLRDMGVAPAETSPT